MPRTPERMRVAFDCRALEGAYGGHGIGAYVRNLLPRLVDSPAGPDMVLCATAAASPVEGAAYHRIRRPAFRAWVWEQLLWPRDLRRIGATVLHSPVSLGLVRSIGLPAAWARRSVATVHDLNCLHEPGLAAHGRTWSFRIQSRALRRAGAVVTDSEYVKRDAASRLGVDAARITVIPPAVDDGIRRIADAPRPPTATGPAGQRFVLVMGEEVNKNVVTAVRAFDRLAARGYEGGLVVAGREENQTAEVAQALREGCGRGRVRFAGRVSQQDLVDLYRQCDLFFVPSTAEGFGLPVIEAMYCGAVVVAADGSSLREAGGGAALYCPPMDADAFCQAGWSLICDQQGNAARRAAGRKHAASFSWETAAAQVVRLYEHVHASNR